MSMSQFCIECTIFLMKWCGDDGELTWIELDWMMDDLCDEWISRTLTMLFIDRLYEVFIHKMMKLLAKVVTILPPRTDPNPNPSITHQSGLTDQMPTPSNSHNCTDSQFNSFAHLVFERETFDQKFFLEFITNYSCGLQYHLLKTCLKWDPAKICDAMRATRKRINL